MSSVAIPGRPRRTATGALLPLAALVLLTAVAAAMAVAIGTVEVSPGQWLLAGAGGTGVLALALWRLEAAVALGLLLLGIVRFEPAPVDGVFAIVLAVALVTGRLDLRAAPLWVLGLLGAFLALNLLSCIEAIEPGVAVSFMAITVYLMALGVFISGFVDSPGRARLVLGCYLLVAVASALLGTLALQVSFPGSALMTDSFAARAKGLFGDPNVYGPFLVVAAVLLLMEILEPRLLRVRTGIKLLALAVLMVGVLFAYSRAAWLNLAVALVVLGCVLPLRRGGGRRALALLVAAIVSLAVAGAVVSLTGSAGFLEERARVQTYDTDRFGAQEKGLEIAQSHPVGVGPGQFEEISPVSAHSIYVRTLAEEGALGFAVLVALLAGTLLLALRNAALGRSTYGISSAGLLAVWCGLLANSFFVDTLHWRHLWLVAGLIWAGAMAGRRGDQASSSDGARTPT